LANIDPATLSCRDPLRALGYNGAIVPGSRGHRLVGGCAPAPPGGSGLRPPGGSGLRPSGGSGLRPPGGSGLRPPGGSSPSLRGSLRLPGGGSLSLRGSRGRRLRLPGSRCRLTRLHRGRNGGITAAVTVHSLEGDWRILNGATDRFIPCDNAVLALIRLVGTDTGTGAYIRTQVQPCSLAHFELRFRPVRVQRPNVSGFNSTIVVLHIHLIAVSTILLVYLPSCIECRKARTAN
jgi:hypothetical protein